MRKALPIALAIIVALMATTAAFAGNGPFSGLGDGKPTVMASTVTADGLAISLKLNANVKDGGSSPFWLRIRRVRGDSSRYLVAELAFSFDHYRNSKMYTAGYTVNDCDVVYSLRQREHLTVPGGKSSCKQSSSAANPAQPTAKPATAHQTGRSSSTGSQGAQPTASKLVSYATNLQFADDPHTLMRIGQLHIGEYVTIKGTVRVEKRSAWGANNSLFFRLHAGVSQVSPDDSGWPQPTWSLTASSLYLAP